jgi:D-alanyl-D-alanine carboxypeptidase
MTTMKKQILYIILLFAFFACRKPAIPHTENTPPSIPWTDTSNKHPMNAQFRDLLEKYRLKGLPGISLLVHDKSGTWVGSTGMADVTKNVPYLPGHVSKIASITKLMVGTLVFKLIEDSVNSGLGYLSLNEPITKWIPSRITDRIPNGKQITLGQCMKHETGVPDLIEQNKFYQGSGLFTR